MAAKKEKRDKQPEPVPIHRRRLLVRPRLYAALVAYCEERETEEAEEMNRAIREMLERAGRWPPTEGSEE